MRYIILLAFSMMASFAISQGVGRYKIGAPKSDFPKLNSTDSISWGQTLLRSSAKLVYDSCATSERFENTSRIGYYETIPSFGRFETYCFAKDTINSKLTIDYAYACFDGGKFVAAMLYVYEKSYQNMIDALCAKYGQPIELTDSYSWKVDGVNIYCVLDRYQKNLVLCVKSPEYPKILEEYRSEREKVLNRKKKAEEDLRKAKLLDGF